MPLGAVLALSWYGEVFLGGILIIIINKLTDTHKQTHTHPHTHPNTHTHTHTRTHAYDTYTHTHTTHTLKTSAALRRRCEDRTALVFTDADRPSNTRSPVHV